MDQEIYYYVEFSPKNADDWARVDNRTFDNPNYANGHIERYGGMVSLWQYRVVKATLTTEIVRMIEPRIAWDKTNQDVDSVGMIGE